MEDDRSLQSGEPCLVSTDQSTDPSDTQAAVTVVLGYLAALEARDIERAQASLSDAVRIIGPGGAATSAAGVIANSSRRYQRVGKHIERCDALAAGNGAVIVYCFGTLHGAWSDGTAFEGIRFIDRFEIRNGCIERQDVWNDAAERRLARAN